jgi:hypothetical protein
MTEQEEHEFAKQHYARIWRCALKEFLNWSEKKITGWIEPRLQDFDRPSLIRNEAPIWYVVPWLIPQELADKLAGARLARFERYLEHVIQGVDPNWELDPDFDWGAARERVEKALRRYGAELPRLKDK